MKKSMAIVGVALGLMAGGVNAAVINFDDLAPEGVDIPNGYAGFNWNNWEAFSSAPFSIIGPNGYVVGTVSQSNVSNNGLGGPADFFSSDSFTVNSLWATAAWNDGLSVTFTGYDASNNIVQTITVIPSATEPTLYELNWAGIYKFGFASAGGTQHAGYFGKGTYVAIDDITVNAVSPVPVPATLALLGLGLIGVARRSTSPR
jgi:hypothetical protein